MSSNEPPANRLESAIERIDRLYGTGEAEPGMQHHVPGDASAGIAAGTSPADPGAETGEARAALPAAAGSLQTTANPNAPGVILADVDAAINRVLPPTPPEPPLSHTVTPVARHERLPVSSSASVPAPAGDTLRRLFADFEQRLRDHLEIEVASRGIAMERRHLAKLQRVRQTAIAEVKRRDAQIKQRYEQQYRKKEMALRENYKKLMALANKISEQKVQLQAARRHFEEKVQAANALYRQVEDMRRTLREQLGALEPRATQDSN